MTSFKVLANRQQLRPLLYLVLAVAVIFSYLIFRLVFRLGTDFGTHNDAALEMLQERHLPLPHFLYHIVVAAVWLVISPLLNFASRNLPAQAGGAGIIATLLFYEFLALVLYYQLRSAARQSTSVANSLTESPSRRRDGLFIAASLSLMVVNPVLLFFPVDHLRYLGYLAPNAYHNPTMAAVKPIALLLFALVASAFVEKEWNDAAEVTGEGTVVEKPTVPWRRWLAVALLTLLSALAKPSFIICLLPALLVYAAVRYLRRRPVDLALIAWGVLLPTVLLLAWQYWFTYETEKVKVMFAPFAAMALHSNWLLPKFALSILFPAAVYWLYRGQARRDVTLNLAWLVFGIACFYSYFMAEAERTSHGNFIWSGQIALFVLFVQSFLFLVRETAFFDKTTSWRELLAADRRLTWCLAMYALHLSSGLYYYVHLLTVSQYAPNRYG